MFCSQHIQQFAVLPFPHLVSEKITGRFVCGDLGILVIIKSPLFCSAGISKQFFRFKNSLKIKYFSFMLLISSE